MSSNKRKPISAKELQVKLARLDSISAELARLTEQSNTWTENTPDRKMDALMRRCDKLQAKFRELMAIPEVHAAIAKQERGE